MRVDAHQHFWTLARGDYRWLAGPGLAGIRRDYGPADLEPLLAHAGIRRTVLVQATDTDDETDFLLEVASRCACVAGIVAWVDLGAPGAVDRIAHLSRTGLVVGVRPMLQDIPDPAWMLSPKLVHALDALVEHDLAFDALVRPGHLRYLRAFVDRHPLLRVV